MVGAMLRELRIRNLAIVPETTVAFGRGLNVLTGETGAGKSILVDAISLLAGRRSSSDEVRAGEEQATVEAVLEFPPNAAIWSSLKALGIAPNGTELILRRIVTADGRSRAFANDVPCTVSGLASFAPHWIDVSGQHGQRALLDETEHTSILDRFGDYDPLLGKYVDRFGEVRTLDRKLSELREGREKAAREREFLSYQLRELTEAKLVPGEEAELSAQHQRAAHGEKLARAAETIEAALSGEEGASVLVARALSELKTASRMDESLQSWVKELEETASQLKELGARSSSYRTKLEFDPGDIERINERLSKLQGIVRKYGSIEKAIVERDRAATLLSSLEDFEGQEAELLKTRSVAAASMVEAASALTRARRSTAKKFGQRVTAELRLLGMPAAELTAAMVPLQNAPEFVTEKETVFGPMGAEQIRFDLAPNPGEGVRPLASIVSGGELSRVLLAIKGVAMEGKEADGVTFLFDEVDSGIGGETAERVGIRLKSLASAEGSRQVFCVTHLAQIACYADTHLRVEKGSRSGRTRADVATLDPKGRKEELARMIGGIEVTPRTLDHAGELLKKGRERYTGL
ncbi:MAG: DNA repair protein RecN [Pseudomonadota bacterium]